MRGKALEVKRLNALDTLDGSLYLLVLLVRKLIKSLKRSGPVSPRVQEELAQLNCVLWVLVSQMLVSVELEQLVRVLEHACVPEAYLDELGLVAVRVHEEPYYLLERLPVQEPAPV